MARRKPVLMDDDDDSSDDSEARDDAEDQFLGENPDERAERTLFENPYQRKRKRPDSDDDEVAGFSGRRQGAGRKKADWTKAPAFVSSGETKPSKVTLLSGSEDEESEGEDDDAVEGELDEDGEGDLEDMDEDEDDDEEDVVPAPRERSPHEKGPARRGLGARFGFSSAAATSASDPASTFSAGSKGGIGSSRGGIGSSTTQTTSEATPSNSTAFRGGIGTSRGGIGSSYTPNTALPSAFGASAASASSRPQQSFVRQPTQTTAVPNMTPAEKRHFDSISNTFGAKMMAKMGWQAGVGLGAEGKGIVAPIETKLRPGKIGIAFKGFKEKTEQSKIEARRRGEKVSDDEERPKKGGRKKDTKDRSEMWKKPTKKTKMKVEHKTYDELIKEAGVDAAATSGLGVIIDATGAVMREVSSMSELPSASWTPSTDPERLPEVRHNLRIIVDMAKGDLDGLAREGKALGERGKSLAAEGTRLGGVIRAEAEIIARLQKIRLVVDEIAVQAKKIATTYEPSLEPFERPFETLLDEYAADYEKFGLDEVVVGAMAPAVRRMVAAWDPLIDPTALSSTFQRWKPAFRMSEGRPTNGQMSSYSDGARQAKEEQSSGVMTPYESLMWNVWLPRVRSSINNSWSPADPDSAILLYTTWSPLLPAFISANMLDQLILPKLEKAVSQWSVKTQPPPLHSLVFPWLPHLGMRSEELLAEAKRKVKNVLRNWSLEDGLWKDLRYWREVVSASEWDAMLLKYLVPKLGATLREEFKVNPRNQKMEPLDRVLQWNSMLKPSVMTQLLETEFFPKWLETLHFWLIQPKTNFEDVAQWYSFWKAYLPKDIVVLDSVQQGFQRGLQLMNKAMELGANAQYHLPRPETDISAKAKPAQNGRNGEFKSSKPVTGTTDVTFRSVVEDFVAAHNLLFVPTGQSHEKSRMPLFRVSPSVDGRGGISVYLLDDAVWAQDGADFKAVNLEEMVLRANRALTRQK